VAQTGLPLGEIALIVADYVPPKTRELMGSLDAASKPNPHDGAEPMSIALCDLNELDVDRGVKGFELEYKGQTISAFLVRVDKQIFAYRNRCPHTGVELNWLPDQFLDMDRHYIQCATHDARFQIEDGRCVAGPCVGDTLEALMVELRGTTVYLRP